MFFQESNMAIVGVESLIYGVDDVAKSIEFFDDFGLNRVVDGDAPATYRLAEGSRVVIREAADPVLPTGGLAGTGVREIIWGVDTQSALDALTANLSADCAVRKDPDGTVHFLTDFGLPMGLRLFAKVPVLSAPDALNAPGHVRRLNQHRKWRLRARPKVIAHVVFAIPDYQAATDFMRRRLGFRLSDSQRGVGQYLRADGSNNHHNLLLLNARAPFGGMDGQARFHHANFGVEDIDEIMVGANYMTRRGWEPSHFGLGRHRVDSALFYYLPCPAGGEAEYGADADYIDDSWVPRDWIEPLFAYSHFVHNLPDFLTKAPDWRFAYLTDDSLTPVEPPADASNR
jgi:catechol 2,3-dioxygenase-like lactoylglutathione lyase family enzyme